MLPISKKNILAEIENTPLDPAVDIRLALLWDDTDKSYYGTSIAPNKSVAAHYHNEGDEIYFIVSGSGIMKLGTPVTSGVEWEQEFEVQSGDFFTVPPQTIHQFINTSGTQAIAIFGCDKNHLGSDRFVI